MLSLTYHLTSWGNDFHTPIIIGVAPSPAYPITSVPHYPSVASYPHHPYTLHPSTRVRFACSVGNTTQVCYTYEDNHCSG